MPIAEQSRGKNSGAKDPVRTQLIESARARWVDRLIDTSRRNNLLFYRPLVNGSIEVSEKSPALHRLLTGETVRATDLLDGTADRPGRILNIERKAQENKEEKGLQTLHIGVGFATWKADDGGRDYKAPVFLVPLQLKKKGSEYNSIEALVAAEPRVNPVLLHLLRQRFGAVIDPEDLLALFPDEPEDSGKSTPAERERLALTPYREALSALAGMVREAPEFKTDCSAAIGNFSFAKMAMVQDISEAGDLLFENGLIAAIAGDEAARAGMMQEQRDVDPHSLDSHPPSTEFCVVDADSSQQCAIGGISAGQSAVVHGPPGTGKSQTITNLIATLVAKGKTVLFVAEKRAALEVVADRLNRSQLGHLAIDLHGAELSPKKVMQRVAETLNIVRQSRQPDCDALHNRLAERRAKLNEHDRRMHKVCARTGMTLYAMQGRLLYLVGDARSEVRWRGTELAALVPNSRNGIRDLLREFSELAPLVLKTDDSPWVGAQIADGTAAQRATDSVRSLCHETLPSLREDLADVCDHLGFAAPSNLIEVRGLADFLSVIETRLMVWDPSCYSSDLSQLTQELERGRNPIVGVWLGLTSKSFKDAVRRASELRKGTKANARTIVNELRGIVAESAWWREQTAGRSLPSIPPTLHRIRDSYGRLAAELRFLSSVCAQALDTLSLEEIETKVRSLAGDQTTPFRLAKLSAIEAKLDSAGLQRLTADLRRRAPKPDVWPDCFDYAWLNSAIDEMSLSDPDVRGFLGNAHRQCVEEFKGLDMDALKVAVERVRREHAVRAIEKMNAYPAQETLIRAEAARVRKHKPLRALFDEAWDVLTAVCPCWMASPLSVSQLISRGAHFDYIIFDEASQVLPEDAVPAILRGTYVVVAGDNQQLPPTGFFSASVEDDDDEVSAADGFESLLDMMIPFAKSFHLNWHYRSRDEALIAFSNHHIYKDRLVTFPGPGGEPAVSHSLVDFVPDADGQEESCAEEVRRVVELVIDHSTQRPGRSLGVIAMGIKHAMRLQSALDDALKGRVGLAHFFDTERAERFFIKNLERVQGDERDSIILSVGYGKNRAGDLPLRFGPILSAGGRRRLNVAVTRARYSMIVVSSFSYLDINPVKVKGGTGLELLRNFLQYAESGGKAVALNEVTGEPMNEFETDVYTALEARGMKLVPQVGCSRFRIDFGVCHPERPGRFVLAIECDGATYHSSATARDRDRLRQRMLENLGWSFLRIWSTDWFLRKSEEIERAWTAYNLAVAAPAPSATFSPVTIQEETKPKEVTGLDVFTTPRVPSTAPIPVRSNIAEYTSRELSALYAWVMSDGALRTHDEIVDEMFEALPFARRGARIDAALRATVTRCDRQAN